MTAPSVGDQAPTFDLPGTGPARYSLDDFEGALVLLVFYPGDDTPVCTRQLSAYSADLTAFGDLGVQILAISPQDVASHESFASRHGLAFPLLADEDKSVGGAYGVVGPLGFYRRSTFLVDGEGVLRYTSRRVSGLGFDSADRLLEAVRAAP